MNDRAIIGGGVLIGTISFIATIPGASFSHKKDLGEVVVEEWATEE